MRLRPSGRQGPVATSLAAFRRLPAGRGLDLGASGADPRARDRGGRGAIAHDVEAVSPICCAGQRAGAPPSWPMWPICARGSRCGQGAAGAWDAKIGPGRLQDIELFAQTVALKAADSAADTQGQLQAGVADGWLAAADAAVLGAAFDLFWQLQTALRFLAGEEGELDDLSEGAKRLILRETGAKDVESLLAALLATQEQAGAIIQRYLGAA